MQYGFNLFLICYHRAIFVIDLLKRMRNLKALWPWVELKKQSYTFEEVLKFMNLWKAYSILRMTPIYMDA